MISPRWRLLLMLIWGYKARSALVILSIAIGVFGVGVVAQMYVAAVRDMTGSYAAVSPANASLFTDEPFEGELVDVVRKMPNVRAAEGRRSVIVRFRLNNDPAWRPLLLFAIPDLADMRINKVVPEYDDNADFGAAQGHWPPRKREVAIERTSFLAASLGLLHSHLGDALTIEMPDHRQHTLVASSMAYDGTRIPATFAGVPYGYITMDTLERLGQSRDFNELNITVTGDATDKQRTQQIIATVRAKVEKSGRTVIRTEVPEPGQLPLDGMFRSITTVLALMSVLSLTVSGFLVTNTITALLKQQVRQIGVMKAIGARPGQLAAMYLLLTLALGIAALLIAMPLAASLSRWFTGFMSLFLNFRLTSTDVAPQVFALEIAVGVLVPCGAALYPIIAATRITVLQAITDTGMNGDTSGRGVIDRLIGAIRGVPRPVLLSLRNTFRRKQRLALTMLTLTLASITFISVLSVRGSLSRTLDQALAYWNYDVGITLVRPYRVPQIEREARSVPGVAHVETWDSLATYRVRPDATESQIVQLVALPATSSMIKPILLQGRWLEPSDSDAVVINTAVQQAEPDLHVGSTVVFKMDDRKTTWRVVGLVQGLGPELNAYATADGFAPVARRVGRASSLQIITTSHDEAFQRTVSQAVEARLKARGIEIATNQILSDIRAQNESLFTILTLLLLVMAALLTAVGGLGLMGTMSINVIERTREIGVMRAIGASDEAIGQIFTVEAVFVGVLSAAIGSVLAIPIGGYVSAVIGQQLFQTPLDYRFSITGVAIWLVGMVLLAIVASVLPVRHAMGLRVREVLAHE